jgi:hypothetical protein
MGEVIQLTTKSELEKARLIREARAIYENIFPPAVPEQQGLVYQSGGIPSPLERSGKDLRWDLDGDNGSKEEHRQWARDPSLPH